MRTIISRNCDESTNSIQTQDNHINGRDGPESGSSGVERPSTATWKCSKGLFWATILFSKLFSFYYLDRPVYVDQSAFCHLDRPLLKFRTIHFSKPSGYDIFVGHSNPMEFIQDDRTFSVQKSAFFSTSRPTTLKWPSSFHYQGRSFF